jgi:hypothetical protein
VEATATTPAVTNARLRMHDKRAALVDLARILGMNGLRNEEPSSTDPDHWSDLSPEEMEDQLGQVFMKSHEGGIDVRALVERVLPRMTAHAAKTEEAGENCMTLEAVAERTADSGAVQDGQEEVSR